MALALDLARKEFLDQFTGWAREVQSIRMRDLSPPHLIAAFQHSYWAETIMRNLVPSSRERDPTARLAVAYDTLVRHGENGGVKMDHSAAM